MAATYGRRSEFWQPAARAEHLSGINPTWATPHVPGPYGPVSPPKIRSIKTEIFLLLKLLKSLLWSLGSIKEDIRYT